MVRKRNRNRGSGSNTGNRQTFTRPVRRQTVQRPLALSRVVFNNWITLDGQPTIGGNQAVSHFARDINAFRFPELQDYFTRYQSVTVHSLGARFISGMSNMSGTVALYVLTDFQNSTRVTPAAVNHAWLKRNECKITACHAVAHAPSAFNVVKVTQMCAPAAGAANPGSSLGVIHWVFEGPISTNVRNHLGEIEVYVSATFDGL